MTIGDVNEQEYCFQLVIFMDRVYHFSDVNEKVYFSDVISLSAMDSHDRPLKN